MPIRTILINPAKMLPFPFAFILDSNGFTEERYSHDCDFLNERPPLEGSKVGDIAWIRENRHGYVRDEGAWLQIYPYSGAGGVGTTGRDPVGAGNTDWVIVHNQGDDSLVVNVTANWPTTLFELESGRTTASVQIGFTSPAPNGAVLNWRVG